MLRIKRYEHTHTNPEKDKTTARRQPKNADKPRIFVKEKPKPNTFVFDLGFDWRKVRDLNPRILFSIVRFQVECNKPDSANLPDMNFQIIDKNFSLGIP